MEKSIPTAADLRKRLKRLTEDQLIYLADKADVGLTTIKAIRDGTTTNPRIETVRAIWGLL